MKIQISLFSTELFSYVYLLGIEMSWTAICSILKAFAFCATAASFTFLLWGSIVRRLGSTQVGLVENVLALVFLMPLNSIVAYLVSRGLVVENGWRPLWVSASIILLHGMLLPIEGIGMAAAYLVLSICSFLGARAGGLSNA